MDSTRDEPLASSRFPYDENGSRRIRHSEREIAELAHRVATSDDVRNGELIAERAAKNDGLTSQARIVEGAIEKKRELIDFEGLRQVVVSALPNRLDRGIDGAVGRHHDDRTLGGYSS